MPIDTVSNSTERFGLAAGKTLVVTPFSPGATAVVAITTPVSGIAFTSVNITSSQAVGPFSASCELLVSATGAVEVGYGLTAAQVAALAASLSGAVTAPATLDSTSAAYNGATLNLAAAGTLTVGAGALAVLGAGVVINVSQSGSATLAFSGAATKENSSGTSASSVTLVASGVYALLPSPSGSDKWRLTGGAST